MAFFDLVRKLRGGGEPVPGARHPHTPPGYPQSVEELPPWAREFVERAKAGLEPMSDDEVQALVDRLMEDPAVRAEAEEAFREADEHLRQRRQMLGLD